jgi:hypothetical protein
LNTKDEIDIDPSLAAAAIVKCSDDFSRLQEVNKLHELEIDYYYYYKTDRPTHRSRLLLGNERVS